MTVMAMRHTSLSASSNLGLSRRYVLPAIGAPWRDSQSRMRYVKQHSNGYKQREYAGANSFAIYQYLKKLKHFFIHNDHP